MRNSSVPLFVLGKHNIRREVLVTVAGDEETAREQVYTAAPTGTTPRPASTHCKLSGEYTCCA